MGKTVTSRLEALESSHRTALDCMFTVHYKDGTTCRVSPGECIELALSEPEKIERFEDSKRSGNAGCMEGLLNVLLIGADDSEVSADV